MSLFVRLMAGLLGTVGLIVAAGSASAECGGSDQAAADGIASRIDRVAPEIADITRAPIKRGAEHITAAGEKLSISIPKNNSGKVVLGRPDSEKGSHFDVGLPSDGDVKDAVIARDGTVTYPNSLKATDLAVQSFQDSVRVVMVIRGDEAPSEFVYPVDVPAGGSMKIGQDGGVLVMNPDGLLRGGFAAPWAKDNLGREVATHYEIRRNTVVQVVAHHGAAYPIIADPWMGKELIKSAAWIKREPGFTLQVTPTAWARKQRGSHDAGEAGWDELYSKYKNEGRGIKKNKQGMRDQYICHQEFVTIRDPGKATWNLDEYRPHVGYFRTVVASCNPGVGERPEPD
ncbi:MAG: DUF2599 domain-containing protein [Pseudonocardiaceae bacterium]